MFGMFSRGTVAFALVVVASGLLADARPANAASIDTAALFYNGHDTFYRSPISALPSGSSVRLRFRTAHQGASAVSVQVARLSPTPQVPLAPIAMTLDAADSNAQYDFWQATVTPPTVGFWVYDFEIQNGDAQTYYGDNPQAPVGGVGASSSASASQVQSYGLVVYQSGFAVPSWLKSAVMYQIFPDRFYNGDRSNDGKVMSPAYGIKATVIKNWTAPEPTTPDYNQLNYYGGDLQGVIDKLPYLKSLGVNVLYLNPIFQAGTNHGYDTTNYMEIASHLGTLKTFKALIAAAHKAHMKVILDGVFNHTSSDSMYFNRYGSFSTTGAYQSQSSPYYGWYTFQHWPDQYSSYFGIDTLPELNESDAVKNFIFRDANSVAQYWLAQGADGWRLDHAVGKSDAYWQEFRTTLKARFPKDALICECDSSGQGLFGIPKLLGNMFDGDMNYPFQGVALGFYAHGKGSPLNIDFTASQFLDALVELSALIPRPAAYASMNVIGTHDTNRVVDQVNGSIPEMKQLAALQMVSLGMPEIYYGDEAGLTGSGQPDTVKRKPFPWSHPNKTLQSFYSKVIHLRLRNQALRDGSVIPLLARNVQRVVAFLRQDAKQSIPVVINDGTSVEKVSIPTTGLKAGSKLVDGISGKSYQVNGSSLAVRVAARSTAVLVPAGGAQ